jgi:hypothetical protein
LNYRLAALAGVVKERLSGKTEVPFPLLSQKAVKTLLSITPPETRRKLAGDSP